MKSLYGKILLEKLNSTFYQWREIKKQLGAILSCCTALDYRWLVLFLPRTAPAALLWGHAGPGPTGHRSHGGTVRNLCGQH